MNGFLLVFLKLTVYCLAIINTIFKVYLPFKWHSREVVSSVSSSHSSHYSGIANPLPSNIGGVGKERVWGHGHTKFVLPYIIFAAVNYC